MKAVILAAGCGSRMGGLTSDIPKGLLDVGGMALLERSLETLGDHGVSEAVIVVGYLGGVLRDALGSRVNGVEVRYVDNVDYEHTGSMWSLAQARSELDEPILLLESDLLYDGAGIRRLLDHPSPNVMLAAAHTGFGDDVYLCVDGEGALERLGKNLSAADRERSVGSLVGITKLSAEFLSHLLTVAELREPHGSAQRHYEELIAEAARDRHQVVVDVMTDLVWTEIDTARDLRRAREDVFPALDSTVAPAQSAGVAREILLNPGPGTTSDAVKLAQVVPDICPRENDFGEMMAGVAGDLTELAGGHADDATVLFGGSGTAGLEAVVASTVPADGRLMVLNNGAYGERIAEIARTYGIDTVEVTTDWHRPTDVGRVRRALEVESNISGVFAVHHETTTGVLNPIAELGALAHEREAFFAVDAISSLGGVPFDLYRDNVDYAVGVSTKCLQAMAGITFVVSRRESLNRIKDLPRRCVYLNLYEQHSYFAATGQMRFTPPVQTFYALRAALDELLDEGVEARHQRYSDSWRVLRAGMAELGFEALTPPEADSRVLTTFHYPDIAGFDFDRLHDELRADGFTIYPGKLVGESTFRIANLGAIDKSDIEKFLSSLRSVCMRMRTEGTRA